jgi:hypothetical protein
MTHKKRSEVVAILGPPENASSSLRARRAMSVSELWALVAPEDALWAVACHEAAHATMRWLLWMKPTRIFASKTGGGCLAGGETGCYMECLLVCLAGYAWDCGLGFLKVDFSRSREPDIEEARRILAACPCLRARYPRITKQNMARYSRPHRPPLDTVEVALRKRFAKACEILKPHVKLIQELGLRLELARTMSARSVATFFHGRERHCPVY